MGSYIGGFFKGLTVGLVSFALGFVALSVVFPVDDEARSIPAVTEESPDRGLPPLVEGDEAPGAAEPSPPPLEAAPVEAPAETPAENGDEAPPQSEAEAPATPSEAGDSAAPEQTEETGMGAPAPRVAATPPVANDDPMGNDDNESVAALPLAPAARDEPIAGLSALLRPSDGGDEAPLPSIGALPPAVSPAENDPDAPDPDAPVAEADEAAPTTLPGPSGDAGGVVVGRLPSIGDREPGPEDEAADAAALETQVEDDAAPELPAYLRFAAPYENDTGLPLMTLLIFDTQADAGAEQALLALDIPVSIVLDPADDDAPRRAALYRDAGHEIVLLAAGLPAGATASDIEVTFVGWHAALPEVVAVMDPPDGVLRGNVMLARNVMPVLSEAGRGLILQGGGLGGLRQAASAEGVPSASVFRSIDDDDESRHTIRRYLDRAVFEAQQQGRVVVAGRAAHEETMAAIGLWRREGRAGEVSLAPVSAALQVQ
ncbi:MAG: divergent polysaccharide deacetylase family protein [Pararhodobacter sp.]|nr:divergent polysaccharide deacetylase family protein [Pararhodobacter sp.]